MWSGDRWGYSSVSPGRTLWNEIFQTINEGLFLRWHLISSEAHHCLEWQFTANLYWGPQCRWAGEHTEKSTSYHLLLRQKVENSFIHNSWMRGCHFRTSNMIKQRVPRRQAIYTRRHSLWQCMLSGLSSWLSWCLPLMHFFVWLIKS